MFRKVEALGDLKPDGVIGVEIDGVPVALYRLGDEVFATHGVCTHALAFLKDGWVEDGKIECPLHQGLFDIRSGRALCAPLTEPVRTYAVKVEGGDVLVDLDRPAEAASAADPSPVGEGRLAQGANGVGSTRPAGPPPSGPSGLPPPPLGGGSGAGTRVVVIGAGQAAAAAIRAMRAAGLRGRIALVGEETHLPYERPPLSKDFLLGKVDAASFRRLAESEVDTLGVDLHLGQRAVAVDAVARTVTLAGGTVLPYDALLFASGGRARRLSVPGAGHPGVFHLRTLDDAMAMGAALQGAKRVAIIGGGFIGLELASTASAGGATPIIVERESELMARLMPAPLGRAFRSLAERHGAEVRLDTPVEAIEAIGSNGSRRLAVVTPGGRIEADLVFVGIGLEPETELAAQAGCTVEGGIVVDDAGRTGVDGIWAAGDCALHHVVSRGRRRRLESWQNAEDQGAAAGRSIAGEASPGAGEPKPAWFWTDQFGINVQMLGHAGPTDRVAVVGEDAAAGAVYRTIDPESGRVTSVVAFSLPTAIRAGRDELRDTEPFDAGRAGARFLDAGHPSDELEDIDMSADPSTAFARKYVWPSEGLRRIPDWVYTDETVYRREIERIFHGRTWNYVALEDEVANPGDFIRSNVGPTPVVVSRAEDGTVHVFENRCSHRAAEFCRELSGNAKEFVCPYHQWSYDLKGNLAGVPFRRGVNGQGGMPKPASRRADHSPKRLKVRSASRRGVRLLSSRTSNRSTDYFGPEILRGVRSDV